VRQRVSRDLLTGACDGGSAGVINAWIAEKNQSNVGGWKDAENAWSGESEAAHRTSEAAQRAHESFAQFQAAAAKIYRFAAAYRRKVNIRIERVVDKPAFLFEVDDLALS
jgi:hypothetical protein